MNRHQPRAALIAALFLCFLPGCTISNADQTAAVTACMKRHKDAGELNGTNEQMMLEACRNEVQQKRPVVQSVIGF